MPFQGSGSHCTASNASPPTSKVASTHIARLRRPQLPGTFFRSYLARQDAIYIAVAMLPFSFAYHVPTALSGVKTWPAACLRFCILCAYMQAIQCGSPDSQITIVGQLAVFAMMNSPRKPLLQIITRRVKDRDFFPITAC